MSRFLKCIVLALALATGSTVLAPRAAQAGHYTAYTVYVWKADCCKWVAVCKTHCYDYACKTARKWADCGYKTCIR